MTNTPNNTAGEWEKDFDENFTYASFTWNGDNKTGADFAKKTKRRVKAFISKTRQEAIAAERLNFKKVLIDYFTSYNICEHTGPEPKEAAEEILSLLQ